MYLEQQNDANESIPAMTTKPKQLKRIHKPLKSSELYRPVQMDALSFESTEELDPLKGVIEQHRAVRALELGLTINSRNYNVYVAGASGTGKTTVVRTLLKKLAPRLPTPPDWIYVHNFKDPAEPMAIQMMAGTASSFRRAMEILVERLWELIPAHFHSREHQELVQTILNGGLDRENERFLEFSKIYHFKIFV